MSKIIATLIVTFLLTLNASAQNIQGFWMTEGGAAKVEIYKLPSGTYEGKIVWTKDQSEKVKKTIGTIIIKQLKKVGDKEYEGSAIDPRNLKSYSCNITVINENQLDMRGYVGISLFGKTENWTRNVKQ